MSEGLCAFRPSGVKGRHSSPMVTMKTYAHALPSLEERLSERLEIAFQKARQAAAASSLLPLAAGRVVHLHSQEPGIAARHADSVSGPYRIRTCDAQIKSLPL